MKKTLLGSIVLVSLVAAGYAVETRTWLHSSQADFEKGVLKRISLRSDGRLTLAPKTDELLDSSTSALWAVAGDSKGNVYAGGGGPGARAAEVFRIDRSGNAETIAELEGLQVQALAVNSKDEVFAATAPDGAIYRVTANGGGELFFEPAEKYIWAMVFDGHGDLFVGTGDSGAIYRVHPDGEGSVFFKTEETHARSLAVDRDGNLIAGTEPSGLIMRISPSGESFVLHQSEKREITTVAVAPDGSIYAAGVGTKKSVPSMPLPGRSRPPNLQRLARRRPPTLPREPRPHRLPNAAPPFRRCCGCKRRPLADHTFTGSEPMAIRRWSGATIGQSSTALPWTPAGGWCSEPETRAASSGSIPITCQRCWLRFLPPR